MEFKKFDILTASYCPTAHQKNEKILKAAPSCKLKEPIMQIFKLSNALALAVQAHKGQVRKSTIISYISYPMAVAAIGDHFYHGVIDRRLFPYHAS
jgi:(p)ppGpp synthase/HD superfamily hydrolase